VPDREAGCSLVDGCPVEPVRAFRRQNPDHAIVSYINTSIEVKAESDILCTSRNAVKVVNSIPREKPVMFLPDRNLGNYVKRETGRENMQIWQGACIVHATFPARRVMEAKLEHPQAKVVAHRSVPRRCWRWPILWAHFGAHRMVRGQHGFRVHRDDGERHPIFVAAAGAGKRFYYVANENCNCSECPYMKLNTLEKLRDCLLHLEPRVELSEEIMARALVPLERMLALKIMADQLIDSFGRVHTNLRISVTDRCNIRCFYCMPETGVHFEDRRQILDFEEIERVARMQ